jgi:hypothetical protein
MQVTTWDFRGGTLPGDWRISGVEVPEKTANGLHITSLAADGGMISELALPHSVEVITMTFASNVTTGAQFMWHRRADPPGSFVELPFEIAGDGLAHVIELNLSAFPQWDSHTDEIGFTFPKGTNVLLQGMTFIRYNILEKSVEAWKSFWTFDQYSSFSINFLWGPLLTFSPIGTQELFTSLPPRGTSAQWLFYTVFGLCTVGVAGHYLWKKRDRAWHVTAFFVCFGILVTIWDARMGAELLSYAKHDYDTWISPEPGSREFRSYVGFNDFMEQSLPYVAQEKSFAFLTTSRTPVTGMVRYFAYPTEVVEPTKPNLDVHTWLVFMHNGVSVDEQGRLSVNGEPWSAPGEIILAFPDNSFLFQTKH